MAVIYFDLKFGICLIYGNYENFLTFFLESPKFELSGKEDLSILHGFIAYLPSALAYNQLKKFKGKPHYLEFLIQIIQKALAEGNADMAVTWCEEAAVALGMYVIHLM